MNTENNKSKVRDEKVTKESATERRKNRRENRHNSASVDWQSVDPEKLKNLIATITAEKGTITFGYTRDGGAYYINYYVDGIAEKVYCRGSEDINQFLEYENEAWK